MEDEELVEVFKSVGQNEGKSYALSIRELELLIEVSVQTARALYLKMAEEFEGRSPRKVS